ncbi:class I SAM-dependent methyltransferase [Pseudarthrobacter raffinosi]|uniref:class I SAM-dependent methyltransferase n=1 Tax=Pseudarthrobacter raffinosi TaxID=2953651 RepID=UPI00208E2875|nr:MULTISPECIES: class I SAM-dependent methyltransferase [unclassified Pseudarthrobacter]MCO4236576.1 class I SAM-dependent methyltransferase [Pseudarthrobacter sp. MDT3-28]MCO4262499.1 class I SAM-dependent methyltransferase [Pseudarthrobacter sp. MDT3-26]
MDLPDCDPTKLELTYRQFGLVNRLFSGWRQLYRRELRPLLSHDTETTLLDIGCGGGDLARQLALWSARDKLLLEVTGIDPDARAYSYSLRRPHHVSVRFRQADSADMVREGRRFDVVISNHVIHHLQPADLAQLLADSQALGRRISLHNDLRRNIAAYALFSLAALPFRGSFIRADGLTSIRRSYTPAELTAAAPPGWQVARHSPFHQVLMHGPDHPDG